MEKLARGFLLKIHQVAGQAVVAYLEAISSDRPNSAAVTAVIVLSTRRTLTYKCGKGDDLCSLWLAATTGLAEGFKGYRSATELN
jgi:hypothetical protein